MAPTIVLASNNAIKIEHMRRLSADLGYEVLSMYESGIAGEAEGDGLTLDEIAHKKALYVRKYVRDGWVMADNTGLFIPALGGDPGIHAARWAGKVSSEAITYFTLGRLYEARRLCATFRTCVTLMDEEGMVHDFEGELHGYLVTKPRNGYRSAHLPDMPYSSLFVPDGQKHCFAEMTTEEENQISHRGIAYRKALAFLQAQ